MSDFPTLLKNVHQANLSIPEIDQLIEVLMAKKQLEEAHQARKQEEKLKGEFSTSNKKAFTKSKPPL